MISIFKTNDYMSFYPFYFHKTLHVFISKILKGMYMTFKCIINKIAEVSTLLNTMHLQVTKQLLTLDQVVIRIYQPRKHDVIHKYFFDFRGYTVNMAVVLTLYLNIYQTTHQK